MKPSISLESLPLANGLEERNKYWTGKVMSPEGGPLFIKALKDPDNVSQQADLENEITWNTTVRAQLTDENSFAVPESCLISPTVGSFEFYEGTPPAEEELGDLVYRVIPVLDELEAIGSRFTWDAEKGRDLEAWYRQRLGRVESVWRSTYFPPSTARDVERLLDNSRAISLLRPGLVHGDFNLKNMLVLPGDTKLVLVDSEFGSIPSKPEWYKPRYEDAAYFYHLIICQYHQADLADTRVIPQLLLSHMQEGDFQQEFQLSVLEKTLSMMSHFVVNPKPGLVIDDTRRTEPEPYIHLVNESLRALSA